MRVIKNYVHKKNLKNVKKNNCSYYHNVRVLHMYYEIFTYMHWFLHLNQFAKIMGYNRKKIYIHLHWYVHKYFIHLYTNL